MDSISEIKIALKNYFPPEPKFISYKDENRTKAKGKKTEKQKKMHKKKMPKQSAQFKTSKTRQRQSKSSSSQPEDL